MTASEVNYIQQAVERASKRLQEDIDFSVMADFYKSNGWTEIKFNPHVSNEHAIRAWLDQHCKYHRTSRNDRWLFENRDDAVNFTLRWM